MALSSFTLRLLGTACALSLLLWRLLGLRHGHLRCRRWLALCTVRLLRIRLLWRVRLRWIGRRIGLGDCCCGCKNGCCYDESASHPHMSSFLLQCCYTRIPFKNARERTIWDEDKHASPHLFPFIYFRPHYFFGGAVAAPPCAAPPFPDAGCAGVLPDGVLPEGVLPDDAPFAGCVPCGSGFGGMSAAEKRGSISSRIAS